MNILIFFKARDKPALILQGEGERVAKGDGEVETTLGCTLITLIPQSFARSLYSQKERL